MSEIPVSLPKVSSKRIPNELASRSAPRVSVFLPTVRRPDSLTDALNGLTRQTYRDFEVVVAYDARERETEEVLARFDGHLAIVRLHTLGRLVTCANLALQHARGEIYVRTDDDAVGAPRWLESVVDCFDRWPDVGGVSGPTFIPQANLQGRDLTRIYLELRGARGWRRTIASVYLNYVLEGRGEEISRFLPSGAFTLGSNFPAASDLREPVDVDYLEACNWSARRHLLEEVGGFDEAFGGVGDYHEPDAAYRIRRLGYRLIFDPRVAVEHRPSIAGAFSARANAYARSRNFLLFYYRHLAPRSIDGWVRFAVYLALMNSYWVWKALLARDLRQLGGVAGTFTGLIGFLPELAKRYSLDGRPGRRRLIRG